ncbi:dihydroorotase [Candidatus Poriferisodalis sp.]|uniref:dihydroorotase n=1 Tax=Candidatus Poriferisodalis sp. TaxID=3101277 RepID=UPI003B01368C
MTEVTVPDLAASPDESAQRPMLVVTGGEIIERGRRRRADVSIIDGHIVGVAPPGSALRGPPGGLSEDESAAFAALTAADDAVLTHVDEIDATGCVVASGFVDLCARVAEPLAVDVGVMQATAASAALGGVTALLAQPDTDPPLDRLGQLAELRRIVASAPHCHIVPTAAITAERAGARLAPLAELASAGVAWFTDTGPQPNWALLCRALQYTAPLEATVAVRPSGSALGIAASMHEGAVSARMGVAGEPAEAEHAAAAVAVSAARCTGGSLHLDRISAAATVELVRAAKAEGLDVSASVTAEHLLFIDADAAGFDTLMRADPPHRTAADRAALIAGINDRTIDAVVSAHTPMPPHCKDVPFDEAPPGFASLETSAAIVLSHPDIELEAALDALSWRPAELAGVTHLGGGPIQPGQPANLVVVDLARPWTPRTRDKTFARVSPHRGRRLNARVTETIVGGTRAVRSGYPSHPDDLARDRDANRVHRRWKRLVQAPRRGAAQ